MDHEFLAEVESRAERRNRQWYKEHLMRVLETAKENHARDIDTSIELGRKLIDVLNEKLPKPAVVPPRVVSVSETTSVMRPVEPEVLDIIYKSTTKGSGEEYLKERYKKSPEERFYDRQVTSWDYGWQHRLATIARDGSHGRRGVLRDTFYRRHGVAPDRVDAQRPATATAAVCSEYECYFN
ncbi:hypothetical protein JYU34_014641 [Plutella xylostella]|uniref:Sperm microtubule inner protein 1 C-terminal domain-containing protein n=1 Tax=Plutella xylostella TaxID=51655 RepID=A0ABQ7Q8V4_PLUXY|nr:hypothetical protein JYU34_014641 [Plutella xylostella]